MADYEITVEPLDVTITVEGTGEVNTTSNVGGGVELALAKSSFNLPFRTLQSLNSQFTIAENGNVVEFDLAIDDSGIDHDALTNTHNLTSDISHSTIADTHNLTTDINHDTLTNTHTRTVTFYQTEKWVIKGAINVAVGQVDLIGGGWCWIKTGQTRKIVGASYAIYSGTSVTFSVQAGGVDIAGMTGLLAGINVTHTTLGTPITIPHQAYIVPVVTAVSGSPFDLKVTLVYEETVTL